MQKTYLDGMTMRVYKEEERFRDTELTIKEHNEAEKKREIKVLNHECRLRDLSKSLKHNNISIMGFPEDEERGKEAKSLFKKIIVENFLNLRKDTDIKSQGA